jgi:hypothetical protein
MPFAIAPAFAPATAALGGAVFGLATTAQLVLNGRLTGFSTIIAATFGADTLQTSGKTRESRVDEAAWKSALVAGLVLGGWWMREALPRVFLYGDAAAAAAIDASRSFFPPPTMTRCAASARTRIRSGAHPCIVRARAHASALTRSPRAPSAAWSLQFLLACWWASARVSARAAPAVTACAGCRGSPHAHSSPS